MKIPTVLLMNILVIVCQGQVESTVQTATGTVRLFNRTKDEREGVVQVYINGRWGNICGNKFNRNGAAVICHQLGFSRVLNFYMAGSRTGITLDDQPAVLTNVRCSTNLYLAILQCSYSTNIDHSKCGDNRDVVVQCSKKPIWMSEPPPRTLQTFLRIDGAAINSGIVLVSCNNKWGYICADGFGKVAANSVCRQLGYDSALEYNSTTAVSGTNVFLGNVACNGIQPCITHCQMCPSTGAPPYNCADGNVVTVTCQSSLEPYQGIRTTLKTCPATGGVAPTDSELSITTSASAMLFTTETSTVILIASSTPPNATTPDVTIPLEILIPVVFAVAIFFVFLIATFIMIKCLLLRWLRKQKQVINTIATELSERNEYELQHNDYVRRLTVAPPCKERSVSPRVVEEVLPLISSALIPSKHIRLLDCIGQGEFGVVYKAHLLTDQDVGFTSVAVKTLKGSYSDDDLQHFIKESLKMKELHHSHVMNLIGVCLDAGPAPYIVLPFMANGDLLSYLKKHRKKLLVTTEVEDDEIASVRTQLFSMCLQISQGMEYLTSQSIIHRDLAARNCMIDSDGVIKVADFGLSKSTYEKLYFRENKSENVKLPIKWLAIECMEDGVFSEKSDVWAFGVTCWEIFSGGKIPYGGLSPLSLPRLLKDGERMEAPDNAACSQEIYKTVMQQCWHSNPDQRPTFSQLRTQIDTAITAMAGYLEFSMIAPCFELDKDADAVRTRRNTQDKTPSQEAEPSGMCRKDSITSEKRISTTTGISLSKQLSEKENTAF